MRSITLFLLAFGLISPAMAQLERLNPPINQAPPAPAGAGQPGSQKLTPDGRVQIGYDKRADYRLIKQPTGKPPTPAQAANTPNSSASPNIPQDGLDGDIFDSAPPPQPTVTNPTVAAAPAAAPKPRSDSKLRSDSSPARDAAAASQAAAAAKAEQDKKQADALAAAIAAAQKAGALPLKPQ